MIAAIGISVLDTIMVMDGFKSAEGSYHCEKLIIEGGGMAATALCTASKLGSQTRLFSRIGNDVFGKRLLEELRDFGVDISGTITLKNRNTTASVVFVDLNTGEKQFYSEWDKSAYIDSCSLNVNLLEGVKIMLVDGHWTEGAYEGLVWARAQEIPVVADFKRKYNGIEKLFPFIDYFIIPMFFAEEITGEKKTDRMLHKLTELQPGIPVITCGVQGGAYIVENDIKRYKAFPIKAVDSTGAGDAFHGAFCHFISHGVELSRCLELSSAVGALNCRAHGGRSALPSREELKVFLKNHNVDPEFP
ncbi:MAG: hypothetical protein JXB48_12030 [Candidatus Latescibacteria bacterium]|nr:hypothetical protein [Candidatus Latescibacterota bacterium]